MNKKGLIIKNLIYLGINIFWTIFGYCNGWYKLAIYSGVIAGFGLYNILYLVLEKEND